MLVSALEEDRRKVFQSGLREGEQKGKQEGLLEGKQEGLLEGKQEGLLEGKQEGLLEGEQKGRIEEKIENAKAMLAKGMELPSISEITRLPESKLTELKDELSSMKE